MTSAVGGGRWSPKSRQKEPGSVNSVRCKGGEGKKIKEMCHKATVLEAERIVMRVEIM